MVVLGLSAIGSMYSVLTSATTGAMSETDATRAVVGRVTGVGRTVGGRTGASGGGGIGRTNSGISTSMGACVRVSPTSGGRTGAISRAMALMCRIKATLMALVRAGLMRKAGSVSNRVAWLFMSCPF